MTDARWSEYERYATELLVGDDDVLEAALRDSDEGGLPAIQVAPTEGRLLQLLARAIGARSILEIGTLGGYSTIFLARGLPQGGRLLSLELVPKHAEVATANVARAGLSDVVDIVVGPALESLERLAGEGAGPFDLVFIDADKTGYPDYLAASLPLSRPGTVIIADNVVRDGEVADESSTDANVQAVRRFNQMLADDPRVDATIVQTVGSKGYDGFAFAVVGERS